MEEIKSTIRPFKASDHYKQSLKGPPLYYRVSLNSGFKRAGTTVVDATFDVQHVFPNQRADLMNGEWHVFLESFEALMASQLERTNIKVCLPDLIKSSQDYVMTAAGVCQINDAVEHVPITQEFRSAAIATYNVPAIAADSTRPVCLIEEAFTHCSGSPSASGFGSEGLLGAERRAPRHAQPSFRAAPATELCRWKGSS